MPNPNPHHARREKKRLQIRRTGDLAALRTEMWRGIIACREILMSADTDTVTTLKACHALSQLGSSYVRLIESTELESRLSELEKSLALQTNGRSTWA